MAAYRGYLLDLKSAKESKKQIYIKLSERKKKKKREDPPSQTLVSDIHSDIVTNGPDIATNGPDSETCNKHEEKKKKISNLSYRELQGLKSL